MSNPSSLVLQILGEGRINTNEAAVLLAAVVARPTVHVSPATCSIRPTPVRDFLPVTLSTVWSGATNEVL